jgi:hypothetical protein
MVSSGGEYQHKFVHQALARSGVNTLAFRKCLSTRTLGQNDLQPGGS